MAADPAATAPVQRLLAEVLNIEVPSEETDLIESGLLDSLALVELLFAIEQKFTVALPLDELEIESFRTVRRIAETIANHHAAKSA